MSKLLFFKMLPTLTLPTLREYIAFCLSYLSEDALTFFFFFCEFWKDELCHQHSEV